MMSKSRTVSLGVLAALALMLIAAPRTHAAYVNPKIGGSQMGHTLAPMIMPEIFFDGKGLRVVDANGRPWTAAPWSQVPVLRPLAAPDEFDPTKPWAVLTGRAYNFQYGWDAALWDEKSYPSPVGSAVWVRTLSHTPGLEVYFKDGNYAPLFGTPGADAKPSSDTWLWDKRMRHNTYAVPAMFYGRLSADYQVYLGDGATGQEYVDPNGRPLYESAKVTLRWLRPCPYLLAGDINSDCVVDSNDLLLLADKWLTPPCTNPDWCGETDINRDGLLDMIDMTLLMDNWHIDCRQSPLDPACTPRP